MIFLTILSVRTIYFFENQEEKQTNELKKLHKQEM